MKKALGALLVLAVVVLVWTQLRSLNAESGGAARRTDPLEVEAPTQAAIDRSAQGMLQNIHDQVATDAVAQYEIAKRGGDAMQTCVQAGMVSASFLQAKNEAEYNKWKAIEKADCAAAGVPQ